MHLDNRLSGLRAAAGMTRAQLASALGVDPSTIARWENREVGIPDARKVELAVTFGVSVPHLMCWPYVDEEGEDGNGGNGDAEDVAA